MRAEGGRPARGGAAAWRLALILGALLLATLALTFVPGVMRLVVWRGSFGEDVGSFTYETAGPGGGPVAALWNRREGAFRIIVLPGPPGLGDLWARFLAGAPQDLEVIVLDRPGYGASPKGRPALALEPQIAAVEPLLHPGGTRKVILIGQSLAAAPAIHAAARHPREVAALIILSGLVLEAGEDANRLLALIDGAATGWAMPAALHAARAELALRLAAVPGTSEAVSALARPVVIVHAERDGIAPLRNAYWLSGRLPESVPSAVHEIAGSEHFLQLGEPEVVWSAIRQAIALIASAEAGEDRGGMP